MDDHDQPRGSAPITGCTEQLSPTCAAGVGQDTKEEFKTLKDTLNTIHIPSELKLNESLQRIQRKDLALYQILVLRNTVHHYKLYLCFYNYLCLKNNFNILICFDSFLLLTRKKTGFYFFKFITTAFKQFSREGAGILLFSGGS